MLTVQERADIFSKVFADSHGRQYRLTFSVFYADGSFKGRLISVEPVIGLRGDCARCANDPLCLSAAPRISIAADLGVFARGNIVSPYFSLEFLINSQPTRGPSLF